MTREELEKEATEFETNYTVYEVAKRENGADYAKKICDVTLKEAYIAGAEPREKQIQIDAEQIRALQKQNGELTDNVQNLEKENAELKEQLTKKADTNHSLVEQMARLEEEKCELLGLIQGKDKVIAELKELKKKKEEIEIMTNFCKACKKMHTDQLTKAKEIIKSSIILLTEPRTALDTKTYLMKAKQFISEVGE